MLESICARSLTLGQGLDSISSKPISVIPFISEAFFEKEKAIWHDTWLMVGRERDLEETGHYLTLHLKVINAPIAVTRLADGSLHAFYNICRHRGSRLLWNTFGQTKSIPCRFHGWDYALDGRLRGIPEPQLFPCLGDKKEYRLKSIAVDTWGGFIFVNLNPAPRHSLQEYFSGLPEKISDYLSEQPWEWYTGYQRRFQANWKDLLNIQHEGYHASHVHKKTLGVYFRPGDCRNTLFPGSPGVCSLLTVLRPEMTEKLSARMTKIQQLSMKFGTTSNWVDQDTSVAAQASAGAINHENSNRFVFDCYTLFPNLMLFVGMDVLSVMRVWPINAHEADWEWDWYFRDELKNFGNLFNREQGRLATRNALSEDWPVCEATHENLRAGVLHSTPLASDMEATVRGHYDALLKHLNMTEEQLNDFAA